MKFYRVHLHYDAGSSAGFKFFGNKREAEKFARDEKKKDPDESFPVDRINVKPTKAGILAALNRYADHPDNG